jgi:hypothetical protein
MKARLFLVIAAAMMLVTVAYATAWAAEAPFTSNSECIECHGPSGTTVSRVDFTVLDAAPVNRATACVKCHWEPSGGHPFHYTTGAWNCGSCHLEMGPINAAAIPRVQVGSSYFNSAASAATDGNTLHAIHSKLGWAGFVVKAGRQCQSCHAPAACTACHENGVDPSHGEHSWDEARGDYYSPYGPATKTFGSGTHSGAETERSVSTSLTCSNPICHDLNTQPYTPVVIEDSETTVTYTGTWLRAGLSGYTANSYKYSNYLGAKSEIQFTGERIEIISDNHPYRGKARISIDGVQKAVIDQYAATVQKQLVVFRSELLPVGPHTLTVEVLREKNAASRDYFVSIDALKLYPRITPPPTPCLDCHAPDTFSGHDVDRSLSHGADPAKHTATETAGSVSTTSTVRADVACTGKCHTADRHRAFERHHSNDARDPRRRHRQLRRVPRGRLLPDRLEQELLGLPRGRQSEDAACRLRAEP